MNKRIIIQKFGKGTDNNGVTKEGWNDYKTVWAAVNNLWGKEFYSAKETNSENTITFTIRYSKDFEDIDSKKYRVYWKSKVYNITFIDNINYKNEILKIKASVVSK